MKSFFTTLLFFTSGLANAQPAQLTPVNDIGTKTVVVNVPAKYASAFPAGRTLLVDSNYTASVFHIGGLTKPRFMAFSPTGVLHVSDQTAGRVFAMPDANNDGVADTIVEAASGFSGNHDIKFYKGAMYVTEPTRIWRCTDGNSDGVYETRTIFINNIGGGQSGGHTTRTVVFDSTNQKVYVSVGSSCNVCRENNRAVIEQYNEDGTGRRVFATGTRNAVGMALHPVTNRLWANNNGSDGQGNEIPPEWIDIVRDNGFYGHPFVYGSGVWFNFSAPGYPSLLPITAADSANVARVVAPAALIRAHTAPMALQFLNSQFGTDMQHGFLSALRGSWNTTNPPNFRGFKVIYGHLSSDQDTTVDYVADFCSGFITDTVNRVFWGRPVGVTLGNDGKVYISSDESTRFILVLTPKSTPLAVKSTVLTATLRSKSALLSWVSVGEFNNKGFDIMKSYDGTHFDKIAFQATKGNTTGNNTYQFTDNNIRQGTTIYYRLRLTDINGDITFGNITTLQLKGVGLSFISPNPATSKLDVHFVTSPAKATISIFTITGRKLYASSVNHPGTRLQIPITQLSAGTYLIQISNGIQTDNHTFIKQ